MPMRWSRVRRRLFLFLAVMGPGIITANIDNDAGGITTYSIAGARYGYSLIWSLIPTTLSLIVVQEMCSRMGVVTGKGLAELIRERFGVRVTLAVMACLVLANLANTAAEFAGVAASLEIFGVNKLVSVPLVAVLMGWLVVHGSYRFVERVFLAASVVYLVYIPSAALADPPWAEIFRQTLRPVFRLNTEYLTMLVTVIGTTIAPWMQFYQQSSVADKGIRIKEYRYARWDVILGCIMTDVIAFFIIVACAATLFAHRIPIESARDAALALEPLAGRYASLLFAMGLLNASVFSAAVLPLSTAYAVCEGLGWETGISRAPREAPAFFGIYISMIALGAGLILLPRAPLLQIMFLSQTLNGLLLAPVLIFMLILINDREVMGHHVNSVSFNLVAWGTAAVMIVLSLLLVLTSFV
jgi:NRAMP (natural resistance-associated macrophage protein)-like metal ion transporter